MVDAAVNTPEEVTEMKRILRVCANQFRRFESAERAKVSNSPLSLVEAREAQQFAEQHRNFAEACEKYAAPDDR